MANDPTDSPEQRVTTDRDQIRTWVEAHDAVPATVSSDTAQGEHTFTFVHREDVGDEYHERTWDEFFETFEAGDMVFVYHESESPSDDRELGVFELEERSAMMDRAALDNDEVEEALLAGETVTTELVETRVVEREVVETDTIETELIDANVLERDVVASELIERDIVDVEFVEDEGGEREAIDRDGVEGERIEGEGVEDEPQRASSRSSEVGERAVEETLIDVTIDERRMDTIEEIESLTVESRVVDVDVDEREDVSVDEFETPVADETIHRAILESDVVRSDIDVEELLEGDRIQTSREGEAIESQLIERRTLEEEVRDRRQMRFRLEESEIVETEVMGADVIDADFVDVGEYAGMTGGGAGAAAAGGTAGAETGGDAMAGSGAEGERPEVAGGGPRSETEAESRETDSPARAEMGAAGESGVQRSGAIELSDRDQGKDVVDGMGEQVGIVADVEGETVYVDPEPGFTDRLKARFNWGEPDQDAYPVTVDQIREITDDEVVLESK